MIVKYHLKIAGLLNPVLFAGTKSRLLIIIMAALIMFAFVTTT